MKIVRQTALLLVFGGALVAQQSDVMFTTGPRASMPGVLHQNTFAFV
jgi:hypothetical protein